MKIEIQPKELHDTYTGAWLKKMITEGGNEVVKENGDLVFATVQDADEFGYYMKLKKKLKVPLILGGPQSYTYEVLGGIADGVCVGEGFEFFDKMSNYTSPTKFIAELENEPWFYNKEKKAEVVIPSGKVDFTKFPIWQSTKLSYYYIAERGCPRKCAYCFTGWTTPWYKNEEHNIRKAVMQVQKMPGNTSLSLMCNDITRIRENLQITRHGSVSVEEYMKNTRYYDGVTLLRFGIEHPDEDVRRILGKPIKNGDIREMLKLRTKKRRETKLFFMTNLIPQFWDWDEFIKNSLPYSKKLYPKIWFKYTPFGAAQHTPLGNAYIRKKLWKQINTKIFLNNMTAYNRQTRVWTITRNVDKNLHKTINQRLRQEHVHHIPKLERIHNRDDILSYVNKNDILYTTKSDEQAYGSSKLKHPCIKDMLMRRKRMTEKLEELHEERKIDWEGVFL